MNQAHLLVKNAILLTMDPSHEDALYGWMTVSEGGIILELGEGTPPDASTVIDAGGAIVAPGFISSHSHLFTSGSRGLASNKSLYEWIEGMTQHTRHADADDIYWCTLHGSLDFINNGITTAYDFTSSRLSFHADSTSKGSYGGELKPQAFSDSQFNAKRDSGLRFIHSVSLDDAIGTGDEVLERLANSVKLAGSSSNGNTVLGVAISGGVQWAASPRTAELEVEAMRAFGIINQPHFLETPHGIPEQQDRFSWYRDAGALGPDLIFGHFIHTNEDIVREASDTGCAMSWQPTSNARLASGIADIPGYLKAGMRVGMGLDDQSCTDLSDPWQNLRMGLYMLRAQSLDPGILGIREVLELHTLGSAKILGVDNILGSLSPGKFADFLIVDPRSPDTGPIWNPLATYVLACGPRNLKQVWIGGELVSKEGVTVKVDQSICSEQLHRRLGGIGKRVANGELI